jgi:5-methylcytosine-specific restriction endonuclease McrA
MTIISSLEQIKNDEIVLPAIQRNFVWDEDKIEKLLDSIMRGYPIGIILLWETYNDIQYRRFSVDYTSDLSFTFYDNTNQNRLKLVLDGQQRLQSLYVALYGTYEGKYCYFDILSGRETEDFREDKFVFRFLTQDQVRKMNDWSVSRSATDKEKEENDDESVYYHKLSDLLSMGAKELQKFQRGVGEKLQLSEEDQLRVGLNFTILNSSLATDPNIVRVTVLDENKSRDSPDRKSESDVLEAFVRINREGTPLTRSDLIFSMLKLNWKESAKTLPEFVEGINKGNSFELDTDFVIRCLFAVSDLGTRFDVDVLRKKTNITKIRSNFDECCKSISSTVDFLRDECWIASSKLLGGYYNFVPFVYYLFNTKNHQVPNSEIESVRKAVYLFGFTSPFSRYADSRLGAIIREVLRPSAETDRQKFPLRECIDWVKYWANIDRYGPQLLQNNPSLVLHLIQRHSGSKVHYAKNAPEIDHIFPQSVLRKKRFDESRINHFANFWILSKSKNQNKSARDPKEYFKDVSNSVLQAAYIDRKLLNYKNFKSFLRKRESAMLERVKRELNFTDSDFRG